MKSEGIPEEEALPPVLENPNLRARRPAECLFPVNISLHAALTHRGYLPGPDMNV